MSAFSALMVDAYRELNARRLFWVTLVLSLFVVSVLWMIDITPARQFKLLFWEMEIPIPPGITRAMLLKGAFISVGLKLWLTWAAAILALISTASIFPEFMASGAIDLVLAKPISRVRLFLIKYFGGLLFAALQITVFSLASFLTIGIRSGEWSPGIFLSIPLVVAFFSFLFCICVLVGVITRSTLMSLLATILFWLGLFALNLTDSFVLMPRVANEVYVERVQKRLDSLQPSASTPASTQTDSRIEKIQDDLADAIDSRDSWTRWHNAVLAAKTLTPKTGETIDLLSRALFRSVDLPVPDDAADSDGPAGFPGVSPKMRTYGVRDAELAKRMQQHTESRSVFWILGTSLIFEAVVLAFACFLFARRDY